MPEPQVILLVEDREDDVVLILKAFRQANLSTPIHVVRHGEEAIHYLAGKGKYAVRSEYPLPTLVLLDLKMPLVDGFEVLRWIRTQPSLSSLLVVVLTSSEQMRDVNRAYQLGANSFLIKPMDFENATTLSQMIHEYWLGTNTAPTTSRPGAPESKRESNHHS
jgi:CheY-like chemotaxis protein